MPANISLYSLKAQFVAWIIFTLNSVSDFYNSREEITLAILMPTKIISSLIYASLGQECGAVDSM